MASRGGSPSARGDNSGSQKPSDEDRAAKNELRDQVLTQTCTADDEETPVPLPANPVSLAASVGETSQALSPVEYEMNTQASLMPGAASAGGAAGSEINRPPPLPEKPNKSLPRGTGGRWKAPARKADVDRKSMGARIKKTSKTTKKPPCGRFDPKPDDDDAPMGGGASKAVGAVAVSTSAIKGIGVFGLGADSKGLIASMMAQAVQAGSRKLHEDISGCSKTVANTDATMKNLVGKVEAQGQALGKIASAMSELVSKVADAAATHRATPSVGTIVNVNSELAVTLAGHNGYQQMLLVRSKLRENANHVMGTTNLTEYVFPDGDMTGDTIHDTVGSVLNLQGDTINDWLMQWIPSNARSQKGKASMSRARDPLQRVKPHFIQALRKKVLQAYCQELGIEQHKMTTDAGLAWLQRDEYFQSVRGGKAMHAGCDALFSAVGASHRVKAPTTPGGERETGATVRHYALVGSFVRHFLEVLCNLRQSGRSGIADGAYEEWRDEICRIVAYWPTGAEAHHGVRLVDFETVKAAVCEGVAEENVWVQEEEEA